MDATGSTVGSAQFDHRLPINPTSLSDLRHDFGRWLATTAVRGTLGPDLVLVSSELCAAALRVVVDEPAPRQVAMKSWLDGGAIVLEVIDAAPTGSGGIRGLEGGDASRGLPIVATLTDVLTVRSVKGTMLLRARKEHAD